MSEERSKSVESFGDVSMKVLRCDFYLNADGTYTICLPKTSFRSS